MRPPRIIAHPVMGWFVIILLVTIAAIPPVFFFVSKAAAQWTSIGGSCVAMGFGIGAIVWDAIRR
jgi:formate hydrogenlyase subunit 3/multisubunit Na+/H+ antiporter MnhD subunit